VCASDDWEPVESRTYRRDAPLPGTITRGKAYAAARKAVLFDLWAGGQDVILLTSQLCRRCGFAAYSPRPTEADMIAKYRHCVREEGGPAGTDAAREADRRRAERTHAAVVAQLGRAPERVLDYGGGDGKLMAPFLRAGANCSVVDHYDSPCSGVRRLGAVIDDLPNGMTFDAIVCSHVLEHLVEPRKVVGALAARLTGDGVLFAEVPDEVWRVIPISDAVTHVNFFTPSSLKALMRKAGLEVRSFSRQPGSYAADRKRVLVAVGGPPASGVSGTAADEDLSSAADATRAALRPSLGARGARRLRDRLPARGVPR
jgi:SAM-dependent methyltransferase